MGEVRVHAVFTVKDVESFLEATVGLIQETQVCFYKTLNQF